jgi:glycosyltransferase involved in cell wall biosynthesis
MRILIVHDTIPREDRSGADHRLVQLARSLIKGNHQITFVSRFRASSNESVEILRAQGMEVFAGDDQKLQLYGWSSSNRWSFAEVLEIKFDVAVLSLWFWNYISVAEDYMEQIRSTSPGTRIAVLTDDRHGYRQNLVARVTRAVTDYEFVEDFTDRELEVYNEADAVVTISDLERDYIREAAPRTPLFVIPFSVETRTPSVEFSQRKGLLFLANFENDAARDAAEWFITKVWPNVVSQMPHMRLTLAGNRSEFMRTPPALNVQTAGYVSNLENIFSAHRLFVSPIRIGTGITTKNVVALAHGLPVLTTSIGTQSLRLEQNSGVLTSDIPEQMASLIVRYYDDNEWWQQASKNAIEHVKRAFSPAAAQNDVTRIFDELGRLVIEPKWVGSDKNVLRHANDYPIRGGRGYRQLHLAEDLLDQGMVDDALRQFRYTLYCWQYFPPLKKDIRRALAGIERCKFLLRRENLDRANASFYTQ